MCNVTHANWEKLPATKSILKSARLAWIMASDQSVTSQATDQALSPFPWMTFQKDRHRRARGNLFYLHSSGPIRKVSIPSVNEMPAMVSVLSPCLRRGSNTPIPLSLSLLSLGLSIHSKAKAVEHFLFLFIPPFLLPCLAAATDL